MSWLPMPRRRRDREELEAARAETNRQRARAEKAEARAKTEVEARRSITRQHAELDAVVTRLTGRNKALSDRLLEAQVSNGFNPVAARRTAERIASLQKAAAEGRAEAAKARAVAKRERKRADGLQRRLDGAVGLPAGGPLSSAIWQPGYEQPKPDTKAVPS
jgi:hypothetical protein